MEPENDGTQGIHVEYCETLGVDISTPRTMIFPTQESQHLFPRPEPALAVDAAIHPSPIETHH